MKNIMQNVMLTLVSVLLLALGSELVFYVLNGLPEDDAAKVETIAGTPNQERLTFFQYDSVLGYVGLPNVQTANYGKIVTHNSKGLRGPEISYEKPQDVKRIALIGDSQTWGWAVDDKSTIGAYLRQELLSHSHYKYEVLNFGATGYGIDQSYIKLVTEGFKYSPDVVVFTYFDDNDIGETTSIEAWGVEKPYIYKTEDKQFCVSNIPPRRASGWPNENLAYVAANNLNISAPRFSAFGIDVDIAESETVKYFANRNIRTSLLEAWDTGGLAFLSELFNPTQGPLDLLEEHFGCVEKKPGQLLANWQQRINFTAELVGHMRDAVEAQGAQFLFVAKPMKQNYKSNIYSGNYANFVYQLKQHQIDVIDLFYVAQDYNITADKLYISSGHLSSAGNQLIAQSVKDHIYAEHFSDITKVADRGQNE